MFFVIHSVRLGDAHVIHSVMHGAIIFSCMFDRLPAGTMAFSILILLWHHYKIRA
jgi:hypothetical protein